MDEEGTQKSPDQPPPSPLEVCAGRFVRIALMHEKLKTKGLGIEQRREIFESMAGLMSLKPEDWEVLGIDLAERLKSTV